MFEQTFKNIDDILYKDAGADSELDYIGQTSWVLFLRYLDDLENEKADEAALEGKEYEYILDEKFRWSNWAMPKDSKGELDHHIALTGPDLIDFVNQNLFPYLSSFKEKAKDNPKTIEYKIGEIFSELSNKVQSGYNLREILSLADELPFKSTKDKHELSHLYETKIKNMGNAGRNGGQYYTPRPLIRAMVEVVNPQIGESVYDGAVGSAGFLCEAYEYMYERMEKTTRNLKQLQEEGYSEAQLEDLRKLIHGENSDLFDVLSYVAYHKELVPRLKRAENAKVHLQSYTPEQQDFLNFVLKQYVETGVSELDESKIKDLLILKYKAIADAKNKLGEIPNIRKTFIGFQEYLYTNQVTA